MDKKQSKATEPTTNAIVAKLLQRGKQLKQNTKNANSYEFTGIAG